MAITQMSLYGASRGGTDSSTPGPGPGPGPDKLAARKPGFNDDLGDRNRRVPRYEEGNDVLYRLGDDDTPDEGTADNKNRNRFD